MSPAVGIGLWSIIGAGAGWLTSRITGTDGRRGALAYVFIGILGAMAAGSITRVALVRLGYGRLDIAGLAGALLGACAMLFSSHVFSRRHA